MVVAPGTLISTSPRLIHGPFTVTAIFQEPIVNFANRDWLRVSNADVNHFYRINATSLSFVVTPRGSGTVAVAIVSPRNPNVPPHPSARLLRIADLNAALASKRAAVTPFNQQRLGLEATFSDRGLDDRSMAAGVPLAGARARFAAGAKAGPQPQPRPEPTSQTGRQSGSQSGRQTDRQTGGAVRGTTATAQSPDVAAPELMTIDVMARNLSEHSALDRNAQQRRAQTSAQTGNQASAQTSAQASAQASAQTGNQARYTQELAKAREELGGSLDVSTLQGTRSLRRILDSWRASFQKRWNSPFD
jgi:hypothetical protein